jgi:hypothetical protein
VRRVRPPNEATVLDDPRQVRDELRVEQPGRRGLDADLLGDGLQRVAEEHLEVIGSAQRLQGLLERGVGARELGGALIRGDLALARASDLAPKPHELDVGLYRGRGARGQDALGFGCAGRYGHGDLSQPLSVEDDRSAAP